MNKPSKIQQDWTPVAGDINWEVDSDTVESIRSEHSYDDCVVRTSPKPTSQGRKDGKKEAKPKYVTLSIKGSPDPNRSDVLDD